MSDPEFVAPSDAPMAKLLSPILMVSQWLFGIAFALLLLMAIFMAIPYLLIKELFYDNFRQH